MTTDMIEVREDFTSELVAIEDGQEHQLGHYVQTRSGSFVVIPSCYRNFPPSEVETKQEAIELLKRAIPTARKNQ